MSNENQQPTPEVEQNPGSDKVSPFLSTPLPQGAPQGQQQSLQQDLTSAPTGSVPKYNLPRGANKVMLAQPPILAIKLSAAMKKHRKWRKCSIPSPANTTS